MSQFEHRSTPVGAAAVRELRSLIDRKQVRLGALSAATGIPRSSLHHKLSGRRELTVADLVRLAIALEVSAAELIGRATAAHDAHATDAPEQRGRDSNPR